MPVRIILPYFDITGFFQALTEDGNPKDDAIAERVNGIIKKNELLQGMRFSSIQEVRKAVATAVHFYNNERPHMSLGYAYPGTGRRNARTYQEKMDKLQRKVSECSTCLKINMYICL